MRGALARASRWLVGPEWVFEPTGAAARVFVLALSLVVALAMADPLDGILAAGGALLVGFGASFHLGGRKALFLALAALGIGATTFAGAVAGESDAGATLVVAAMGFVCGRLASRGAATAWILLQCAIAGTIATSFARPPAAALEHAAPAMIGGLAQATVIALAIAAGQRFSPPPAPDTDAGFFATRIVSALVLAMFAARALHLRNGYWAPMTALLVLRPGGRQTMARAISRVIGTAAGAAIASGVVLAAQPSRAGIVGLVVTAAFGAYLFQRATYALFSASVSAYVIWLATFAGQRERDVALARIVATALGGGIALGVQVLDWAVRRRHQRQRSR